MLLSKGNEADITHAPSLIEGIPAQTVIADKGYDSDPFIKNITDMLATAVIPPRSNRTVQRDYDKHQYKDRNLVERFFQKIKNFRRIATRYEKLDSNFMAMLLIVSTYIWLA
jgi:transposase